MNKKVVATLLSVVITASLVAGCGSSKDSGSSAAPAASNDNAATIEEAVAASTSAADIGLTAEEQEAVDAGLIALDGSLPIIKDPEAFEAKYGKISMLLVNSADRLVAPGDLAMCQKWFEDTGVEFDWQPIPGEGAQEKINLMLASGDDLPDAFWSFGDGKSGNIVVQYADQDIFLPTEGLINEYMPNLKKILDDHPTYWMEITAPNGHTYGFPYIEEMYGLVLTGGPLLINQTWLDELNLDMPTTVDELTDVLRAFKAGGDLNGNGVDDEIPLASWFGATDTFGSYNMFYRLTGCFGQADSYCGGNAYADHLRLIDGNVVFTAQDEAFKKTAEYFNQLYSEGLIWEGSFEADESASYKSSLIKENVARIGVFGTWTDQEITDLDVHDEYVAIPRLTGEAGKSGFLNNYSQLQDSSDTAITTTCKFPHVIARFVDYMVGDPAISVTSNWGAVGYNYAPDENGILRTPLDEQG
ncbi:MAG: extracellular solute-binding protein [Oscillospiraceae bacterium]|nr:extracellular solute-binding protein [Oscillospiraceae bacterium]